MRRTGVTIGVIVALAAGVAAWLLRSAAGTGQSPPPPAAPAVEAAVVEVAPVRRGTIETVVELTGSIISSRRVELTPKLAGRIAAVLVTDGARVARGQPIITLEDAELRSQVAQAAQAVAQARAGQEAARARLAALVAGPRAQERAVQQNAVAQAEASLRNAEANAARMQQLFDAGAVSRQQLEAAVLARDVARAQLDSARQQWNMMETGARVEDIRLARAQVAQADAGYAAAVAGWRVAQAQLANTVVRAPFAGRLAEMTAVPGQFVAPGSSVAVLYDDRAMEAQVTAGERDLARLRAGLPVLVRSDALPGATMRGVVRLVLPSADPATRAAVVRIRLVDPPARLIPGISVQAAITVERRTGVLLVPASALREDGTATVIVVKANAADPRVVQVGARTGQVVEIRRGVAEGEQVVTLGPAVIGRGQPVKVVGR